MAAWECSYLICWKCCWWLVSWKCPPTWGVGAEDTRFFHLYFLSLNKFGSSEASGVPSSTSPEKFLWCKKYVWKLVKDDPGNYPACLESFCGFIMFINFSYSYYYDFFFVYKVIRGISYRFELFAIGWLTIYWSWFFFSYKKDKDWEQENITIVFLTINKIPPYFTSDY